MNLMSILFSVGILAMVVAVGVFVNPLVAVITLAATIGLTVFFAMVFRRVVAPNEVHIVQTVKATTSYGKDTENGNVYYEWPSWCPIIGVEVVTFPISVFKIPLMSYSAYDSDRVPFDVDIMAFFRITDSNTAASRVASYEELQEQLTEILRGAIRAVLAKGNVEEIMGERGKYANFFTDEVAEQLKEWGVSTVKNIELMDIRDPKPDQSGNKESQVIENIMAKKQSFIDMESRSAVALNNKTAEVKEIEAKREQDLAEQEAIQTVGERTAMQFKEVGIAKELAQQAIKEQAKETAEKDMAVKKVQEVRQAEITRGVQVVHADEIKQTEIIKAEGEKQQTVLVAEGNLQETLKQAEGIQAVGEATADAAEKLNLADVNPQIVLATEIGDNKPYQEYLLGVEEINKNKEVGIEQAQALQDADVKIIANTGNDVSGGMGGVMDIFTTQGGTKIAGAIEAMKNSEAGAAVLDAAGVTFKKSPTRATKKAVAPKKGGAESIKAGEKPSNGAQTKAS